MRVPVLCAHRPLRISVHMVPTYSPFWLLPSICRPSHFYHYYDFLIILLSAATHELYKDGSSGSAITGPDGGCRRRTTASRRILGAPLLCRQAPAQSVQTISQPLLPYHRAISSHLPGRDRGDGGPDPQGDHLVETANTAAIGGARFVL